MTVPAPLTPEQQAIARAELAAARQRRNRIKARRSNTVMPASSIHFNGDDPIDSKENR